MNDIIETHSKTEFIKCICETIKEQANINIKDKGSFTFVLSGGNTPKDIFIELSLNYKDSIDWRKVHFFWLDERCVEPTHKDSNYKLAYDNLISKLDIIGSVHRMKGELEPNLSALGYQQDLKDFFGINEIQFDFILLGMGEDGHVASLFPNSKEVKLVTELVLATDKKYNGYRRVTLGLNLINMCKYNLLMLKGEMKMDIYQNSSFSLPIHKIKNIQKVVYLK